MSKSPPGPREIALRAMREAKAERDATVAKVDKLKRKKRAKDRP